MAIDLNIAWSPSTKPETLHAIFALASSFGYTTLALNQTLTSASSPITPIPAIPSSSKHPTILHRATLPLADPAANNYRLPPLVAAYDILAVRPTTAEAFQSACLTLDVPIISLDLTQHFQFYFRPKPCMAAVARGVRFEICYSQALGADPRGRANFIGNVQNLVRATRGRGIMLASEAADALALRPPADIVNLLSLWGLNHDKGIGALNDTPRSVVMNEGLRRRGFRGVIDIVETAQSGETSGKQNQKRKGDQDGQALSRRQAKKMKLAARTAAAKT